MTVQQLIDKLNKIENKESEVLLNLQQAELEGKVMMLFGELNQILDFNEDGLEQISLVAELTESELL